jgi:hypothetical protein
MTTNSCSPNVCLEKNMSEAEFDIENTFIVVRSRRGSLRSVNTLPLNWTAPSAGESRCVKICGLPLDLTRTEIRSNFDYAECVYIPFDLMKRNKHHGVAILTFTSHAVALLFMRDETCHQMFFGETWHFFSVDWGKDFKTLVEDSRCPEGVSKIFVGGLEHEIDQDQVTDYFAKFGVIKTVEIIRDKRSGRSKGFAFVEFAFPASPEFLQQTHTLADKPISVKRYHYSPVD